MTFDAGGTGPPDARGPIHKDRATHTIATTQTDGHDLSGYAGAATIYWDRGWRGVIHDGDLVPGIRLYRVPAGTDLWRAHAAR